MFSSRIKNNFFLQNKILIKFNIFKKKTMIKFRKILNRKILKKNIFLEVNEPIYLGYLINFFKKKVIFSLKPFDYFKKKNFIIPDFFNFFLKFKIRKFNSFKNEKFKKIDKIKIKNFSETSFLFFLKRNIKKKNKIIIKIDDQRIIKKYQTFFFLHKIPIFILNKNLPKNLILKKIKQFNSSEIYIIIILKNFLFHKFDLREVSFVIKSKTLSFEKSKINFGINLIH